MFEANVEAPAAQRIPNAPLLIRCQDNKRDGLRLYCAQLGYADLPLAQDLQQQRLEAIIETALRKLPRNRYPSMEDMLEDLERLLGQRSGNLAANSPFEPDVDRPQGAYAKNIASILYKKLGKEAPRWE